MNYTAQEYAQAIAADLGHIPHTERTHEILALHIEAMGGENWEAADDVKNAAWDLYRSHYPTPNNFPSVYNGFYGIGSCSMEEQAEKKRGIYRHCYEGSGYAGMGAPD